MEESKSIGNALIRMHKENFKSSEEPDWLYATIYNEHPNIQERLKNVGY